MINNLLKVALCLGIFGIQYGNSMENKYFINNYWNNNSNKKLSDNINNNNKHKIQRKPLNFNLDLKKNVKDDEINIDNNIIQPGNKEQNEIKQPNNRQNSFVKREDIFKDIINDWRSEYNQLHNDVETIIKKLDASEQLVHNADDAHSLIQNATNTLEKLCKSLHGKYWSLAANCNELENYKKQIKDRFIDEVNAWSTLQTIQEVKNDVDDLLDCVRDYASLAHHVLVKKTVIAPFEEDLNNLNNIIWQKLQQFVKQFSDKQPNYLAKQYRKLVEDNDLIYHNVIQASPLFWDFDK